MRLYFSGIAGSAEASWLHAAGVTDVLVDPYDLAWVGGFPNVALDSGAYRKFAHAQAAAAGKKTKGAPRWLSEAEWLHLATSGQFAFAIQDDVIGDPVATAANWERRAGLPGLVPVWGWGEDLGRLAQLYRENTLVAVGGLAKRMHDRDEDMLRELEGVATLYGDRLHILGINWPKAIVRLRGLVASGDTSKFLDGGRYGHLIFEVRGRDGRGTGRLSAAPARIVAASLGLDPDTLDRGARNTWCARALAAFCAHQPSPYPADQREREVGV